MRRIPWQLVVGLAIVVGWVALAIVAPVATPVDPLRTRGFLQDGTRSIPPPFDPGMFGLPLGSDRSGRDLWANLVYGTRATFGIAGLVLAARAAIGIALGAIAGWAPGSWLDRAITMLIDAFAAFPTILFAVLWIFAFDIRSGTQAFVLALAITGWHVFGRAMRAALLDLRGRAFLEAARAGGLSSVAIFARHLLPNVAPMLAVTAALEASAIVLVLGELGFLGFVVGGGTSIPLDDSGTGRAFLFGTPEWGAILAQGRFEIFTAPWIVLSPALAFASAVLAFALIGHGLRIVLDRSPVALHRLFSRRLALAAVAAVVAFQLVSPQIGPGAALVRVSRTFDGERAREHVAYLADPARAGRAVGTAGYAAAAAYVAEQMKGAGLEPLGDDGSFYQRFRMPVVSLDAMPTFERLSPSSKRYVARTDFSEAVGNRRGGGEAEGLVVYAGGGIRTGEYSDYQGTHPEGNIVMLAGPPQPGTDPIDTAIRSGARAVILVRDDEMIKFSYLATFEAATIPVIVVTEAVADELIAETGKRIADLRQTLVDRRRRERTRPSLRREIPEPISFDTSVRVRIRVPLGPVRQIETMNIAGMIRGGDPARANRFVVVGGHLDGVGTDPDGTVFPGANDNASGPSVAIEVARVLAASRDRLGVSVIVVAFAGEEYGLLGSEAFVNRSLSTPYRPDNVISFVNLDVTGCCGSELGGSDDNFALRARVDAAADRLGVPFGFASGTSDQVSYVRRRVPSVMISWSEFGPIHTTRDAIGIVETWRLRAAGEVALQTVLELAVRE